MKSDCDMRFPIAAAELGQGFATRLKRRRRRQSLSARPQKLFASTDGGGQAKSSSLVWYRYLHSASTPRLGLITGQAFLLGQIAAKTLTTLDLARQLRGV